MNQKEKKIRISKSSGDLQHKNAGSSGIGNII